VLKALFTDIVLEPHLAAKAKARDEYRELLLTLDERIEGRLCTARGDIRQARIA
jgi:hypothetical protein